MNSERGNVLFYILVAVALLAALTFAVAQSNRGSIQQVNDEKARLLASEIIEYANVVANATAQLRLRGVPETSLCFDDPSWGGANYNHAGCTDDANKIFHASGGGVAWKNAPSQAMSAAASPDNLWHIYSDNEVQQIGTTCGAAACSDLILMTDELNQTVCMKINELLNVGLKGDTPPTDANYGTARFTGSFGYSETIGDEGGDVLSKKTAGCFQKTSTPTYAFYKVLIAR